MPIDMLKVDDAGEKAATVATGSVPDASRLDRRCQHRGAPMLEIETLSDVVVDEKLFQGEAELKEVQLGVIEAFPTGNGPIKMLP
jgi:hypothetical protein